MTDCTCGVCPACVQRAWDALTPEERARQLAEVKAAAKAELEAMLRRRLPPRRPRR